MNPLSVTLFKNSRRRKTFFILAPLRTTPQKKVYKPGGVLQSFYEPLAIQISLDSHRIRLGYSGVDSITFPFITFANRLSLGGQILSPVGLCSFDALVCPASSEIPVWRAGVRLYRIGNSFRSLAIAVRHPEWGGLGCRGQQPRDDFELGAGAHGDEHPASSI